jgi:hypothetical protein
VAKKTRAINDGIPLLRDLVELGRFDDAIGTHAPPLLKRLEELRKDPARWTDPPNWAEPPFTRAKRGNPLGPIRPWAMRELMAAEVKDRAKRRELLQLIGLPPLRPL